MGFFSKIGKVFRKVVKAVTKVLPIALAIGAAVFTGGAALGLAPFAGGWGAAAGSLSSFLGLGGTTFGSVLTGAVTQAGYGALLGAGGSLLTGGNPVKGAQMGALAGAVTGGVMGAAGLPTDPLKGVFGKEATAPVTDPSRLSSGISTTAPTGPATSGPAGEVTIRGLNAVGVPSSATPIAGTATPATTAPAVAAPSAAPAVAAPAAGVAPAAAPAAPGTLSNVWSSVKDSPFAAGLVSAAGRGLAALGADDDDSDTLKIYRAQQASYSSNPNDYLGRSSGLNPTGGTRRPTAAQKPRYEYDPEQGRIVLRNA